MHKQGIKGKINILLKIAKIKNNALSIDEVKKRLGMAHATYTNREDGDWHLGELETLADLFGVSVLFFFPPGDEDMKILSKYIT